MTSSSEFKSVTRRGSRAASASLVVHARRIPAPPQEGRHQSPPSRVGFVVSKAVGNAVTRNRVKRRLRHLVVPLLHQTPPVLVVVRANAAAAAISGDQLGTDLERAWQRAMKRVFPETPDADRTSEEAP